MPRTDVQEAALFERPSSARNERISWFVFAILCCFGTLVSENFRSSGVGLCSHFKPFAATGQVRAAISDHLRFCARFEQPVGGPHLGAKRASAATFEPPARQSRIERHMSGALERPSGFERPISRVSHRCLIFLSSLLCSSRVDGLGAKVLTNARPRRT